MNRLLIDLLRHGETTGEPGFRGSIDDPLSACGWHQMEAAIEQAGPWDRIVSSPLRRCADFARVMAQRRAITLQLDVAWRELHFGCWEGLTAQEVMTRSPETLADFWRDPRAHPPPDGEPLDRLQARLLASWMALFQQHSAERVLVVTHGGPIRIMLCQALGRPVQELLSFEVDHGALIRVCVERGGDGHVIMTLLSGLAL